MEFHRLCLILPPMPDTDYRRLVEDIRVSGLQRPITLHEGKILDGRHRFTACNELGIAPRFETYAGEDAMGFVASSCVHRSLNSSQRSLIAVGFLQYEQEQAKARQVALAGSRKSDLVENFPQGSDAGKSRDKAGERMGVSGRSVADAKHIVDKGIPEVVEKIRSGEMMLNEARKVVALNTNAQRQVIGVSKKERSNTLRKAVNQSTAAKVRFSPPVERIAPSPGTTFTRKFIGALERLAMMCAEEGFKDATVIAAKFDAEMDYSSQPLVMQLDRCMPIIYALAIIQQYKRQKAA